MLSLISKKNKLRNFRSHRDFEPVMLYNGRKDKASSRYGKYETIDSSISDLFEATTVTVSFRLTVAT